MKELTAKQQSVLSFIRDSVVGRGYPPSLRDICDHLGTASTNGANCHVDSLIRKGYLVRDPMKSRGLRLVIAPPTEIQHHLGMFTAGTKYMGTFLASPEVLQDVGAISTAMRTLVERIGMTTLGTHIYDVPMAVKRLGQDVESDEGGVTAVVVLSTSHAAIHTWPEDGGARFDVDSCREFDVQVVCRVLEEFLGAHSIVASDLSRALRR